MLYYRAWRLLPSVGHVTLASVRTGAAPLIYKHTQWKRKMSIRK